MIKDNKKKLSGIGIKIGASLACSDLLNLENEINLLKEADIDSIHIDIMDGIFTKNYSLGTEIIKHLEKFPELIINVHYMGINPYEKVNIFKKLKIKGFAFHIEAEINPIQTIKKIKDIGWNAGIAINSSTHERNLNYLYEFFDYVVIMTVEAGFAGQSFIETNINKVREIRSALDQRNLKKDIYVDGHINENTIPELARAGANAFICGSTGLFTFDKEYKKRINIFSRIAKRNFSF